MAKTSRTTAICQGIWLRADAPSRHRHAAPKTAIESMNLEGVTVVTLSACETGLGKVAGGEGLLGLQRSFQAAGARAVVASLWKVDDQGTQMLMVEFCKNLWEKKVPKLETLREARVRKWLWNSENNSWSHN
jgi:CHAT domain-containing protein